MGQQQLLLIILGVVIVGIAIAVGLSMFSSQSVGANRDAIVGDLIDLAAGAYQFRIRPWTMGGGGGTYVGYAIPGTVQSNENGSYVITSATSTQISFTGTSAQNYGSVSATFGTDGRIIGSPTFTGQF